MRWLWMLLPAGCALAPERAEAPEEAWELSVAGIPPWSGHARNGSAEGLAFVRRPRAAPEVLAVRCERTLLPTGSGVTVRASIRGDAAPAWYLAAAVFDGRREQVWLRPGQEASWWIASDSPATLPVRVSLEGVIHDLDAAATGDR